MNERWRGRVGMAVAAGDAYKASADSQSRVAGSTAGVAGAHVIIAALLPASAGPPPRPHTGRLARTAHICLFGSLADLLLPWAGLGPSLLVSRICCTKNPALGTSDTRERLLFVCWKI